MIGNVKELIKAHEGLKREVYLDIENGGVVANEVLESMLPYFNQRGYGNPTLTHKPGWEAYETIIESTQKIAGFLGCKNIEEINFTPGETEANNLALLGSTLKMRGRNKKIVISQVEPLSVTYAAEMLKEYGFSVVKIPVDNEGFINLQKLEESVDRDTVIVSISTVNHEIGTVQPIKKAVSIVKSKNTEVIFHTDASDAYGKIPFNVEDLDVDLATVSSYKILGPRGIGALYVKEGVNVEGIL
ncbi:MAG: aminotransferase class V-fold PLP-dependent enzyme, partial [Candidatus Bathyarchaeia archaeon]